MSFIRCNQLLSYRYFSLKEFFLPSRYIRSTPYFLTEGEDKIRSLLESKLQPSYLHVQDISGGCGSMYEIVIDSAQFKGKRPVQQHRLVNEALGEEVKSLHGLTIRIGNPEAAN